MDFFFYLYNIYKMGQYFEFINKTTNKKSLKKGPAKMDNMEVNEIVDIFKAFIKLNKWSFNDEIHAIGDDGSELIYNDNTLTCKMCKNDFTINVKLGSTKTASPRKTKSVKKTKTSTLKTNSAKETKKSKSAKKTKKSNASKKTKKSKSAKNTKKSKKSKVKSRSNTKTARKTKKSRDTRPSPSESATLFPVGTIKIGNDGNKWIVKDTGRANRWVKVKL